MRKTNKNAVLVFVLLLLVAVSAMMVASTYAKYTAEVTGKGTATVAKWAFGTENANKNNSLTVALEPTVDATTLVNGKIAPGTSGKFEIQLTNKDSEVGVDFEVALGDITNKPTNLKFYTDKTYATELDADNPVTGQIVAGDSEGIKVPVYWKWAYETPANSTTGDAADTTDGEAAKELTVNFTVKGVQTQPSATAITTHVGQ